MELRSKGMPRLYIWSSFRAAFADQEACGLKMWFQVRKLTFLEEEIQLIAPMFQDTLLDSSLDESFSVHNPKNLCSQFMKKIITVFP